MSDICSWHNPKGGKRWKLTGEGIEIEGEGLTRTVGEPLSIQTLWDQFGDILEQASWEYNVPVDIVAAMIPIESGRRDDDSFDPESVREEPGYISDQKTPHLVSPGVMQTLISTARETADRHDIVNPSDIDREMLFDPFYSIMIGTAYICDLIERYEPDPVLMCAGYNAGGVYHTDKNEWKLLVYGGSRINWYIKWFNDFRAALREDLIVPDSALTLTDPCEGT